MNTPTSTNGVSRVQTSGPPPGTDVIPTWKLNWQLVRYQPWTYLIHSICVILAFTTRVIPGLIEKSVFDSMTGAAPAGFGLWELIALYVSVELGRLALSFGDI